MYRMYLRGDKIWTVSDDPPSAPLAFQSPSEAVPAAASGQPAGAPPPGTR
jgi:hypothetical protein